MRKLMFVGVMIFCMNIIHAQEDGYEVDKNVLNPDSTKNDIDLLNEKYGNVEPGKVVQIFVPVQKPEPKSEETPETPPTPESEAATPPAPVQNVASSGSSRSSSARKSSSRKRSKRKKISFKRKRPNKIKRKPKLRNRAACPRF